MNPTEYQFLAGLAQLHYDENIFQDGVKGTVPELIRFGYRAYIMAFVKERRARMEENNRQEAAKNANLQSQSQSQPSTFQIPYNPSQVSTQVQQQQQPPQTQQDVVQCDEILEDDAANYQQ